MGPTGTPAARPDDWLPPYGTVVFDCDSTLSAIEGIDELAGERRAEIAALTERAMRGELRLEEVYARRLELLRPSRAAVEALGRRYVAEMLPHARELARALTALGKRVHVVTGGVLAAVQALARELALPPACVHAVEVFHDREGAYAGFDELSPLARGGGKLEVVRSLASTERGGGVALVGDGATDLEAAPACRRFVAFGGVARRPEVLERAACVVIERDLAALLPLLAAPEEIEKLAALEDHALLVAAARACAAPDGSARR